MEYDFVKRPDADDLTKKVEVKKDKMPSIFDGLFPGMYVQDNPATVPSSNVEFKDIEMHAQKNSRV